MNIRILSTLLCARKMCETYVSHKNGSVIYSLLKQTRHFSVSTRKNIILNKEFSTKTKNYVATDSTSKHKVFRDEDSKVILDVDEERDRIFLDDLRIQEEVHDPYSGLNLERGIRGVYDIEDLILVLEKDNAKNIFVASVPAEYTYVDYIVIVTGKSQKHMNALAEYVRKVYKLKMHKKDVIPKIEGPNSNDWIALDLGNIALHIFSTPARKHYDLETLWTVGSDYDDETNKPETDIMEQYNEFLKVFQPAEA